MCGIAGFGTTGFGRDSRAVVVRMAAASRYRGPDDAETLPMAIDAGRDQYLPGQCWIEVAVARRVRTW